MIVQHIDRSNDTCDKVISELLEDNDWGQNYSDDTDEEPLAEVLLWARDIYKCSDGIVYWNPLWHSMSMLAYKDADGVMHKVDEYPEEDYDLEQDEALYPEEAEEEYYDDAYDCCCIEDDYDN